MDNMKKILIFFRYKIEHISKSTIAAATILIMQGCALSHTVQPTLACPGSVITVTTTNRNATAPFLEMLPPGNPDLTGVPPGSTVERETVINEDTSFQLTGAVGKFGGGSNPVDETLIVDILEEPFDALYNFTWNSCIVPVGSELPPGQYATAINSGFSEDILVRSVRNTSERRLRLTHVPSGTSVDLRPGTVETAFNGLSARGEWSVQLLQFMSMRGQMEGCPDPDSVGGANTHKDPPPLQVAVTAGCP